MTAVNGNKYIEILQINHMDYIKQTKALYINYTEIKLIRNKSKYKRKDQQLTYFIF